MYTHTYSLTRRGRGRRGRLRAAGGLLMILGAGHAALVARSQPQILRRWVAGRLVDTVSIGLGESVPVEREVLEERVYFWAGLGSFAVPTCLLGAWVWDAARRDTPLPRWLGPGLIAWSATAGTIMLRAPWPAAVVAGALVSSAAHSGHRTRPHV